MTRKTAGQTVALFDNYWATTLAFARSLGSRGIPLHVYGSGAGRWSRYCTRRMRCPPAEHFGEFQAWLREKIRDGEITRIAPTTDLIAYHVSALRSEFAPEVQRTIAPLVEIENCLIKTRFAAHSAAANAPMLPTLAPDSVDGAVAAAAALGYPVMVKPKSHLVVGFSERGRLVMNEAELLRHYRRYQVAPGQEGVAALYPELVWPLLQRYIATARYRVYSVTGFKDFDGGVQTAVVSYKQEQWPPDVGVSTLQVSHNDKQIRDFGLQIVNRVLSRGIFELELLMDGENLYPIDLNPRAFGFLELDIARGADLPWLWFQSTMQLPAPVVEQQFEAPFQARHWLLHIMKAMSRAERTADALVSSSSVSGNTRVTVSMVGHRSDPLPMIVSNLHLLRHPRSLVRAQFASGRVAGGNREGWVAGLRKRLGMSGSGS